MVVTSFKVISKGKQMQKLYVIMAISAIASAVFFMLPDALEHISHYTHWLTIVVSGHHIATEVAHTVLISQEKGKVC